MKDSAPLIRLQDVSFAYGEGEAMALKDIDLEIQQGEFVSIIGHNGSGKSTLAKLFNALLLPTRGDVIVGGKNTKDGDKLWAIRQQVGMVFQNPDNQIVATTVEEDVAFGPENLGLSPDEIGRRVDEALALVGMEEHRHRATHLLSGGQKQRVAIAGVIAMRPSCIILDEPTSMLDPVGRREVLETVQRLNRQEGITVVLVTHFMEEAALAERVLVMADGGLALSGPPAEIFSEGEQMRQLRLDVPQIVQLAWELRRSGIPVPREIFSINELVDYLCQYA
ncbi:MAG: energy-coupling factor transporter ATPase [Limnochordia bacterium]|nr:energy-coupling factor transporter ATPase [Bacillota bacterium]